MVERAQERQLDVPLRAVGEEVEPPVARADERGHDQRAFRRVGERQAIAHAVHLELNQLEVARGNRALRRRQRRRGVEQTRGDVVPKRQKTTLPRASGGRRSPGRRRSHGPRFFFDARPGAARVRFFSRRSYDFPARLLLLLPLRDAVILGAVDGPQPVLAEPRHLPRRARVLVRVVRGEHARGWSRTPGVAGGGFFSAGGGGFVVAAAASVRARDEKRVSVREGARRKQRDPHPRPVQRLVPAHVQPRPEPPRVRLGERARVRRRDVRRGEPPLFFFRPPRLLLLRGSDDEPAGGVFHLVHLFPSSRFHFHRHFHFFFVELALPLHRVSVQGKLPPRFDSRLSPQRAVEHRLVVQVRVLVLRLQLRPPPHQRRHRARASQQQHARVELRAGGVGDLAERVHRGAVGLEAEQAVAAGGDVGGGELARRQVPRGVAEPDDVDVGDEDVVAPGTRGKRVPEEKAREEANLSDADGVERALVLAEPAAARLAKRRRRRRRRRGRRVGGSARVSSREVLGGVDDGDVGVGAARVFPRLGVQGDDDDVRERRAPRAGGVRDPVVQEGRELARGEGDEQERARGGERGTRGGGGGGAAAGGAERGVAGGFGFGRGGRGGRERELRRPRLPLRRVRAERVVREGIRETPRRTVGGAGGRGGASRWTRSGGVRRAAAEEGAADGRGARAEEGERDERAREARARPPSGARHAH